MRNKQRHILLSFDVEEFDLPLEYRQSISLEEQLTIGYSGFQKMGELLFATNVPATLYTTVVFAENYREEVRALSVRHEIASHTWSHTHFETEDLLRSKQALEAISATPVYGLRMPRLKTVAAADVLNAGYQYNSSINPTWLPGRYNNLSEKRTLSQREGITILPVSVSPRLRIPLFWLAFKNMPYKIFLDLAIQTLKKDGYLNLYFHPWELADLGKYRLPFYIKRNPDRLFKKLSRLIADLSNEGDFSNTKSFLDNFEKGVQ
ncbi:MAG: polysaccharide deacetylase family protein [Niabella sp.]|nr:polysaccharide deacetylase family protein [Niabella sp.]